jgi:organic radical activating enzyme
MNIKYPIETTWIDYPDNESLAIILYVMGCGNGCKGCHNPEFSYYHNRKNTRLFSYFHLADMLVTKCIQLKTNKIVISGGDCLSLLNFEDTKNLLSTIKFISSEIYYKYTLNINICIYTGYTIESVKLLNIKNFNFIKCGCYKEELKQESIKTDNYIQFASSNQKLYDCNYKLLSENGRYYFK